MELIMPLFEIPQSHLAKTVSLTPFVLNGHKKTGRLKKLAFTLAETLITLVIVGVVAALAIPALISKYQKHTYVAGVKKAYSVVSQAVKMIPITENVSFEDGYIDGIRLLDLLEKQLKVVKKCDSTNIQECVDVEAIKKIPDCFQYMCYGRPFEDVGALVTEDGMTFSSSYGIWVDVNGKKGPNKLGRDIFIFRIADRWSRDTSAGTVYPAGAKLDAERYDESLYWNNNPASPGCDGKDESSMDVCAGRVLEENAMNY